ncbi:sulfotransferase family protein [Enemella sp. A6]|uniref:sulfotransferase family protein n=1 Tax=Enemella sp. A6 TaxID=3440152 RepID=UPI003EB8704B
MTENQAPQDIYMTNLVNRELTPAQQQMVDYANANPVPYTVEAVQEAAKAATGLDEKGPDDYIERLQVWIDVANEECRTPLARMSMFALSTKFLANRRRVYNFLEQHPEVLEIEIKKPVMVMGMPRSGTSHLVNLLAADSRFRAAPIWELDQPVPDPGQGAGPDGIDPRYKNGEVSWQMAVAANPILPAWHPMQPYRIEEDIEIFAQDFSGYYPEHLYQHAEQWRDYYLAHDQTPHYEYLKKVLQIMTYFRPRDQWVTKYPAHIENIPALLNVFPDAILVETHRDPVGAVLSNASMATYMAPMWQTEVDPKRHLDYWTGVCSRLLQAGVRDRHLAENQVVDIDYKPFVEDNWYAINEVYKKLDLEVTDEARQEIQAYIDSNTQGSAGRVRYDLRGEFGVEPEAVREHFADYMAAHDVPVEIV